MNQEFVNYVDTVKIEKIKDGLEWFYSNYESFKKYYPGKHVAIKNKIVIDCDTNLDRLLERLQIKDYNASIAIEFVYS
jgi:hypothetical protein